MIIKFFEYNKNIDPEIDPEKRTKNGSRWFDGEDWGYDGSLPIRPVNVAYITDEEDMKTFGVVGRSTSIYSIKLFINDTKKVEDSLESKFDIDLNKFLEEIFLGKKVGFLEWVDTNENTGGKDTVLTVTKIEIKLIKWKGKQLYFNDKLVNPWTTVQVADYDINTPNKPEHQKLEMKKTATKYNL